MAEINHEAVAGNEALRKVLDGILTDLTALRTAIVGITAQLDADGGVTDTDYASNNDPSALETT